MTAWLVTPRERVAANPATPDVESLRHKCLNIIVPDISYSPSRCMFTVIV